MPNRIPSLDGLRALSILLVIAGHLLVAHGIPTFKIAYFGVQVFFVISGFLITSLLEGEQESKGAISLTAFYRRRCFRILPASFVYIAVMAAIAPSSRSGLPYALTYSVSYFAAHTPLLLQHLWSLSVEEQFYLLWPLALALAFRRRAAIAWATIGVAACFRAICASVPGLPDPHFSYAFPFAMDAIAAGCLAAIYREKLSKVYEETAGNGAMLLLLPVLAWLVTLFAPAVLMGIGPCLVALWVGSLTLRRCLILENRAVTTIGALSYSLYLWQQPFTLHSPWPVWASIPALVGCALLSYYCVEKPMISLGRIARPLRLVASYPTDRIRVVMRAVR